MTQAAILVGGRGTRLGGLTAETPKPLLLVNGAPFLDILVRHLHKHGVDRILLLAGYRSEQIMEYALGAWTKHDIHLYVSTESVPDAGTGGALWHARALLDETFLLLNGDTFFDIDPNILLSSLNQNPLLLGVVAQCQKLGIEGGVYAFSRLIIDFLRPKSSLEEALNLLSDTNYIGITFDNYFIDIGTPEELERARRKFPR